MHETLSEQQPPLKLHCRHNRTGVKASSNGAMNVNMDELLEALLKVPESSPSYITQALERILHRQGSEREKERFLERSSALGSQLQEAADRLARELASYHNSVAWPLTQDLSLKVFSLLGMHSLCQAAASCTMFNKLAMEPACFKDVDLTARGLRINNRTVEKIIQHAGQHLRSLKLGTRPHQNKGQLLPLKVFPVKPDATSLSTVDKEFFVKHSLCDRGIHNLTKSCLEPLTADRGGVGVVLITLHLFNIKELDTKHLCIAIAACPSLTDFEAVGLYVNARSVLQSVASHCHNLNRLCFQPPKSVAATNWRSCGPDNIKAISCNQLIQGCPNILSLSMRGFKLVDERVNILIKGLHHLREIDFSGADLLTGSFLRDLTGFEKQQLESLILRDCARLREVEVQRLLYKLSTGECRSLRYLDVSNKDGLAAMDWFDRLSLSCEAISRVRKERPELELLADFPEEKSCSDSESMSMASGFGDSDDTGPLQSADVSEDTTTMSTSDTEEEDDNDDDDDDDAARFMSPFDYSDGENGDLFADSDSAKARSDTEFELAHV